jgi:hypothetical protein
MKLYLISTCIKINKRYSIFHFKGYFQGEKINEVYIEGHEFHIGAEYLMKIKPIGLQNSSLYGKVLKFKKLN